MFGPDGTVQECVKKTMESVAYYINLIQFVRRCGGLSSWMKKLLRFQHALSYLIYIKSFIELSTVNVPFAQFTST